MSSQIIVLGLTFILFGIIAWVAQEFTVAYLGLIMIGAAGLAIGLVARLR